MKARFQTEVYVASHLHKTIKRVVIDYTPTAQIIRPKPDYTYDRMPGMKQNFLFMPLSEGVTLMRRFSCWCSACMHAWAPGEGSLDTAYACLGCTSPTLQWTETSIARTDATGISNARQRALHKARELTKQLQAHFQRSNQPIWVAVQNRGEDDVDQCVASTSLTHLTCTCTHTSDVTSVSLHTLYIQTHQSFGLPSCSIGIGLVKH